MKINTQKLKEYAINELNWLQYYSLQSSKENLNNESPIYDQLISIGYAKKNVPLYLRCSGSWIELKDNNIYKSPGPRDIKNGTYTALEAYLILYPESFKTIKQYILRETNVL